MGPQSFDWGNGTGRLSVSPAPLSLQWGLSLSTGETTQAAFFEGLNFHWLQWGLSLSTGETGLPLGWTDLRPLGFNGASVFRLGKLPDHGLKSGFSYMLQWGLSLSTGETEEEPSHSAKTIQLQWGLSLSTGETAISADYSTS